MKKKTIVIKSSGMYVEVLVYDSIIKAHNRNSGRKSNIVKMESDLSEEELQHQAEVQAHSVANTLRNFKRLLFANFSHGFTFLTLTFDSQQCDFDITDIATCRTKFTNFWKNLKRGTKEGECFADNIDLRYLGVIEFHKGGSIHFHVLCHIPRSYAALLKKKWQHGHLDFKRPKKNPLDVKKIASYMRKGIHDPRLNSEKHRYLASRGLKKPKIFKFVDDGLPIWINGNNSELVYQNASEYGFQYYQFFTELNEDELLAYIENADSANLQYLIEQMEMIQVA